MTGRCEYKFPLTKGDYEVLLSAAAERIPYDAYGGGEPYTVSSLYFDDVHRSLYHQTYNREPFRYKLRLRVYGKKNDAASMSFFEIKSKHLGDSVKRRLALPLGKNEYLYRERAIPDGLTPADAAKARDILRLMEMDRLEPASVVSYERLAFAAPGEERLRVTFDSALRIRCDRLELELGADGIDVMTDCFCVMEVKSGANLPLWLTRLISSRGLGNKSYSKYGHTPYGFREIAPATQSNLKEYIV